MSILKKRFLNVATDVEEGVDALLLKLRKRLKSNRRLQIATYRSYGTTSNFYVKGRVLIDKGIRKSTNKDTIWSNLLSMYRRFESDEVPHAVLKVESMGKSHLATTDSEGYFEMHLGPANILPKDGWLEMSVELIESPFSFSTEIKNTAHILLPPLDAEFGIISDIDDTVVKTNATNLIAMARNTFFNNAHTRLPFAGVSEFYKSLQLGKNGKRNNPFFYVSSSPWNLYDLLIDFLDLNDIPKGPLLLRDFGLERNKEISDHLSHKFSEITKILTAYPHLNFVLIGDSGQEDPKIYHEVVNSFPGRILSIYIRDVRLADRKTIAIEISERLLKDKVEMIIVDNTVQAAEHASKIGLIFKETIPQIVIEKEKDKGETSGKEAME